MELVADPRRFQSEPIGRCVAGPTYLMWCAGPDLAGAIQWGIPDARDVRDMFENLRFIHHPELAPSGCVLQDCRDIERTDPDVHLEFVGRLRETLADWSPRIKRHAIIVPDGLVGIMLSGAMPLVSPSHPFRFVATLDEALAYLDHPGARAAHDEACVIAATARSTGTLLARLRPVLAANLVAATVKSCADALAVSTRTLQRELSDAGTSFSIELRRARVAAATELLRVGNAKHDVIAAQVGFGNSSRMNAVLREELGVTATELRTRKP